jgi:hypothetical protein
LYLKAKTETLSNDEETEIKVWESSYQEMFDR